MNSLVPALMVFEDLQWADPLTIDFFRFVTAQIPERLALVFTCRKEELHSTGLLELASRLPSHVTRLRLELSPLKRQWVQTLAGQILGADEVPPNFADYLLRKTAGIPLLVEDVLRWLRQKGHLSFVDGQWVGNEPAELDLPEEVRDQITGRLLTLRPDGRLVVRAAAVLGVPSTEIMISEVAGLSLRRAVAGLEDALQAGLMIEDPGIKGSIGLRHGLAMDAVLASLPGPTRRLMNLRAARALEMAASPATTRLAHHLKNAGESQRWVDLAERAAESASMTGDERTAAGLLLEAASAPSLSPASRARIGTKLAIAALYSLAPDPAANVARRIVDGPGLPPAARGELRFWVARLEALGRGGSSFDDQMSLAVRELRNNPPMAARAMADLAVHHLDDVEQHRAWLAQASSLPGVSGDPVAETAVQAARALGLLAGGNPDAWSMIPHRQKGGSIDQKLEVVRSFKHLATTATYLGHYRRAGELVREAEEIRTELGHSRFRIGIEAVRLLLDFFMGRWDNLQQRAERQFADSAEAPGFSSGTHIMIGMLSLGRGRVDDAEAQLRPLFEIARASGAPIPLAMLASALTRLLAGRREWAAALEVALPALDVIRIREKWIYADSLVSAAVDALVAAGRDPEAAALVEDAGRKLARRDAPAAHASLAEAKGSLAQSRRELAAASKWFGSAEAKYKALPRPLDAARAAEKRALVRLASGDRRASTALLAALDSFDSLGAMWDAARVKKELRAQEVPIPYPRRGGRRSYGAELSPRESEVVDLVRSNHTNQEIADRLFISRRTVEDHVASSIRKLALRSRRDLARGDIQIRWATQIGGDPTKNP